MTHPNQALMNLAHQIETHIAHRVTETLDHIARELSISDGWPTSTLGDGGSRTTAAPDARIIAAAERRCDLIGAREQIRDDLAAFQALFGDFSRMLDSILRVRVARPEPITPINAQRCAGTVHPEHACPNWASTHTNPLTGAINHEHCDHCWQHICWWCTRRATEGRYIDNIAACEACYRRALRAGRAAA